MVAKRWAMIKTVVFPGIFGRLGNVLAGGFGVHKKYFHKGRSKRP